MVRRENDLPEELVPAPGYMSPRNPGVVALWTTRDYSLFRAPEGGVLLRAGEPVNVTWWAEGRAATRAEVEASIETGLPNLQRLADQDGLDAVLELARLVERAKRYLPKELVTA
jgi:hypothetical protein